MHRKRCSHPTTGRCTPISVFKLLLDPHAQTNILSVAATPDLQWVIGGCMDPSVHIWHIQERPAGTAPAAPAALPAGADAAASSAGGEKQQGQREAAAAAAAGQRAAAGAGQQQAEEEGEEEDDEEDEEGPQVQVIEGPDGSSLELIELTCGGYAGKVRPGTLGC